MKPCLALLNICLIVSNSLAFGRNAGTAECGTGLGVRATELFLHKQSQVRRLVNSGTIQSLAMPSAASNSDLDGIAIIDDADGVVARRNPFSLGQQTIRFTPGDAAAYRVELPSTGYDADANATAVPLTGLGDDDSRAVNLPFPFPFYGRSYSTLNVNSDGNLTFTAGDFASSDRSVARFNAGPPRIAPLFSDLDPSRPGAAVKVFSDDSRVVISWSAVPVYTDSGVGARQTFQVRLYASGVIEFAYANIAISGSSAVVGVAPGSLSAATQLVSLLGSNGLETNSGIAEFFSDIDQVDVAAAAQKFYASHEDSYDYLFFFNAIHLYISNGSVVAFEDTVRNSVQGYGVGALDDGLIFGSPRRLQAVMNMGPIEQYPSDPYALIPARLGSGDTGIAVLGHEAGHRFLAWTSVHDRDSGVPIMWGRSNVHWSFNFNSEASLVEGNRLQDNGAGVKPRFAAVAAGQGYSPLDQYLFGFRAPEEVPAMFAAVDTDGPANASPPHPGATFNGRRYDIGIEDMINEAGARVPDSGVAQRKYRFGFVLIQPAGSAASEDAIALVSRYRSQWVSYWDRVTESRSVAEIEPKRALNVSFWPSAELTLDGSMSATVSIAAPLDDDLSIAIEAPLEIVSASTSVTIPAGETSAQITLRGMKPGVETVTIRPGDGAFEVVESRVRVK